MTTYLHSEPTTIAHESSMATLHDDVEELKGGGDTATGHQPSKPKSQLKKSPDISSLGFYSGPSLNNSMMSSKRHAQHVRRSLIISPSLNSIHSVEAGNEPTPQGYASQSPAKKADAEAETQTELAFTNSPSIRALSDILNKKVAVSQFEAISEESESVTNDSVSTFQTAKSHMSSEEDEEVTAPRSRPVSFVAAQQPDLISLGSTVKDEETSGDTPTFSPDATFHESPADSPLRFTQLRQPQFQPVSNSSSASGIHEIGYEEQSASFEVDSRDERAVRDYERMYRLSNEHGEVDDLLDDDPVPANTKRLSIRVVDDEEIVSAKRVGSRKSSMRKSSALQQPPIRYKSIMAEKQMKASEQPKAATRRERPERPERSERLERNERNERTERTQRTLKPQVEPLKTTPSSIVHTPTPTTAKFMEPALHHRRSSSSSSASKLKFKGLLKKKETQAAAPPPSQAKKERRKSLFSGWRRSLSLAHMHSRERISANRREQAEMRKESSAPDIAAQREMPTMPKTPKTPERHTVAPKAPATPQTPLSDNPDPFQISPYKGLGISNTLRSPQSIASSVSSRTRPGDALFPKRLDADEVQNIASIERSISMNSIKSNTSIVHMVGENNDSFEQLVTPDGRVVVKSPPPATRHTPTTSRENYEVDRAEFGDLDDDISREISEMINVVNFGNDSDDIDTDFRLDQIGNTPDGSEAGSAHLSPAFKSLDSALKPATRHAIMGSLESPYVSREEEEEDFDDLRDLDDRDPVDHRYSDPEVDYFAEGLGASPAVSLGSEKPHRLSVISKFSSKSSVGSRSPQPFESPTFSLHSFSRISHRVSRGTVQHRRPKKSSVQFSSQIILCTTYAEDEYDRHPEDAACNRLTPQLAMAIKDEMNEFKAQMVVNEDSRCYTQFF